MPKSSPDSPARFAARRALAAARARLRALVSSGWATAATLYPGRTAGVHFDRECLRRVGKLLAMLTTKERIIACPEGPATHFLAAATILDGGGRRIRGLVVGWPDKARPGAARITGPPTRPGERVLLFALVADTGASLVRAAEALRTERKLAVRRVVGLLAYAPAEEEFRKAGLNFLTVHRLNGELAEAGRDQAWRDLQERHGGGNERGAGNGERGTGKLRAPRSEFRAPEKEAPRAAR